MWEKFRKLGKFLKFCTVGDKYDILASIKEGLKSYEEDCREDDKLRSYDSGLRQLTEEAIQSLATGEGQPLSFDTLTRIALCLVKISDKAVEFIIESEEDVWNNEEFPSLVKLYLESSNRTLELCNALEKGVKIAKTSQKHIDHACREFESEDETSCKGDGVKSKYKKTLEELKKFKEAGEPFKEDFFELLKLTYEEQEKFLKELETRRQKLDQKIRRVKRFKRITDVLFATTSVSILVLSVVAVSDANPSVVQAVLGVLSVERVGSLWRWCSGSWKKYEEAVTRKIDIVSLMETTTSNIKAGIVNVRALASSVQAKIEHLLVAASYASKEEEVLKHEMNEIKKELDTIVESVEGLDKEADKFIKDAVKRRRFLMDQKLQPEASSAK